MVGTANSLGKRRIVDIENRKRALFSCDRCKIRKIKCRRVEHPEETDLSAIDTEKENKLHQKYDNITPCIECVKSGISCTTTMPRRKRFCSNVENSNLHYKCLLSLAKGLFPDKDIYSIDSLIELGRSFSFDMPVLNEDGTEVVVKNEDHTAKGPVKSFANVQHTIKKVAPTKEEDAKKCSNENRKPEENEDDEEEEEEDDDDGLIHIAKRPTIINGKANAQLPLEIQIKSNYDNERLIKDGFGHTHFIGNFGTASLLNGLCDIIVRRSFNFKPPVSSQGIRDSSVQKIVGNESEEPMYQSSTHLFSIESLNLNCFPLVNILKQKEADSYVDIFFEKVHPYYFIFNESRFRDKYEVFWKENERVKKINSDPNHINDQGSIQLKLSSSEICCIYMVWILGRRFQQFSNPQHIPKDSQLNMELVGRYIDIIKLALSDIVLTPTINGIRLLIMLSVYLSSIKVRESGYCLMQLAAIQCKSLGLHRRLIVNKFSVEKADEMKRILWSLAKIETTLCCSLGRASAIPWEDIDIDFPLLDDVNDELYKFYYFKSGKLTQIIFKILDNKKKLQREPLSLINIEKALISQKELKQFWNELPDVWKDYKSLPIKRYKPKLHIQYHFYFITLTLPMILHIVNTQNYKIRRNDPIFSLLINSIKSSFQTAEIVTYTNNKGFFNGTLYYDIFYSYNAIMVLTLTYILFKSNDSANNNLNSKGIIDLDYLNENGINLESLLTAINLIRNLILNNLDKIDGTMRRISDIIETLLEDLGIINILVETYQSRPSSVKKIEIKGESGKTSVSANIPTYLKKFKMATASATNNSTSSSSSSSTPSSVTHKKKTSTRYSPVKTRESTPLDQHTSAHEPVASHANQPVVSSGAPMNQFSQSIPQQQYQQIQPQPQQGQFPNSGSMPQLSVLAHSQQNSQSHLNRQNSSTASLDSSHPAARRSYNSLFKNFARSTNNSTTNVPAMGNSTSNTNLSSVVPPSSSEASDSNSAQNLFILNNNQLLQQQQQQQQQIQTQQTQQQQVFSGMDQATNSSISPSNQNIISPAAVLDTELMDLLFGGDLINAYKSASDMFGYGYEE